MTDILRLTAPVEIEAAAAGDTKPRRLAINAYNGDLMTVPTFGAVVIDLAGMTLPASLPVLADHRNELPAIVASGSPKIDHSVLSVLATLADSEAARNVVSLLASGVSLQASVGAEPTAQRRVQAGETVAVNGKKIKSDKAFTVIEKSTLREISVTPIGADNSTSVTLAAAKGTQKMTDTMTHEDVRREERARMQRIEKITAGLHVDGAGRQRLEAAKADAVEGRLTIEALQAVALDCLRAERVQAPFGYVAGSTPRVTTADHLTAAIMVRAGYGAVAERAFGAHIMEQSKPLHGASLADICRAALMIDGRPVPHGRDAMIRAGMSTGSMPIALGDSANKVLAAAYQIAPAAWRSFAAIKATTDFKENTAIRPTFAGDLEELGDGGEVKHASYEEETYTWQVAQYAKQLKIGRKAIVNDDASVFTEVLPGLARAAMRTLSGLVAETILANTGSFWSTGNANYFDGVATALSASSLATAIQKLRQMKDADDNLLDLMPAVLLVPPELEQTAKALVTSATLQRYVANGTDQMPMGNPLENVAQVAVEPRLSDSTFTGYSTTAWYLFSAPANAAVIVGFLDGLETPTLETFGLDSDIDHLAFGYRVYHDFGASLGDFRAAIKSKGAA